MKKNGRVYKRMVITYILVLCIPILFSVYLYQSAYNIVSEQVQEREEDLLKTIQASCDREISYFKHVLLQVKYDQNVKQLVQSSTLNDAERRWLGALVGDTLRSIKSSLMNYAEFCPDVFVYLIEEDAVISVSSRTDYDLFCRYIMNIEQAEGERIKERLVGLKRREMFIAQADGEEHILMAEPMTGNAQNVVLGVWIDPEVFVRQVRDEAWNQGTEWAFVCGDGQMLYGTEALKNGAVELTDPETDNVSIGDEKYLLRTRESDIYDGKYIFLSSAKRTVQSANKIRNVYLLCMAASVCVGYLVMRFSVKKTYIPLEKLVNLVSEKTGDVIGPDELRYLESRVSKLQERYYDLQQDAMKNKRKIRENLFHKLLNPFQTIGGGEDAEAKALFEKFRQGVNMVLLFRIREGVSTEEEGDRPKMDHSLKCFVLANVLAEGVGEKFVQETIDYEERVVMIVNLPEGEGDELLRSECDKYCGYVEENFGFKINAFAGNGYKGRKGIHYSYLEACQAENFGMDSDENYICYREISDVAGHNYQYSLETEEMVINAMRDKNADLAGSLINKVLEKNFDHPDRTLWQCMLCDIYATLMKMSDEMLSDIGKMPSVSEAFTMTTLQELQKWFYELIGKICAQSRKTANGDKGGGEKRDELFRDILLYIRENFKDPDLNVAQIALKFRMSPVYMSTIFKRQVGKSILDVIRQLRMEHAKKLLEEGMSVYDVTPKVGFRDSTAFGRAFKNYYGVSPGKVKK